MPENPTKISEQQTYYDQKYSFEHINGKLRLIRAAAILEELSKVFVKDPKIIDLGCGSGWFSNILSTFGRVTGVDLSAKAIEIAKEKYRGTEFLCENIINWDYPKGLYDVVISQEVIEHIEEQDKYIRIMCDLLKPGGTFILTTCNKNAFSALPESVAVSWQDQPVENKIDKKTLERALKKTFINVEVKGVAPTEYAGITGRIARSKKIEKIMSLLGLKEAVKDICLNFGAGLHLLATGQKKGKQP